MDFFHFAVIDATTGLVISSVSTTGRVNQIVLDAENIYLAGEFGGTQGINTGPLSLVGAQSDLPDFNFPILDWGQVFQSIPDGNGGGYVGGSFQVQGKTNLIRIKADKTIDNDFAPNPNAKVCMLCNHRIKLYLFNGCKGIFKVESSS